MNKIWIFLLFCCINLFAQKEANFWYFGENAGIDFSTESPVALNDGKLNTLEGCSSISDKDGNLLFYTDGSILYNRNHDIMTFSSGSSTINLGGNSSSTQSALFVPNPSDTNIYYLFTIGTSFVPLGDTPNPGFNFYTIDSSLNSGLGEITAGPVNLAIDPFTGIDLSDDFSEKLTAVQADCDKIWVISAVNNEFFAYKITGTGVDVNNPTISTTDYLLVDKRGYLKVSPDGQKIALADYDAFRNNNNDSALLLYDFNAETGTVSNGFSSLINPNIDGSPYGVEFSQRSNKLYTYTFNTVNDDINIIQFDLTASDISTSKNIIHSRNNTFRGALQLAPNGNIYVSVPGNNFLDAIENPNSDNPIFVRSAIDLGSGTATQGLPPFIQSFFAPVNLINSSNISEILSEERQTRCEDEILEVTPEFSEDNLTNITYLWTKENDSSVNYTSKNITINNSLGSGIYLFEAIATDDCGRQNVFSGSVEIEFIGIPTINTIPVVQECDFDSNPIDGITNFNLTLIESAIYSGSENVNISFFETTDTSFLNPIDKNNYRNSITTITNNHKLVVRLTNNDTKCFEVGEIEIKVNASGITNYSNIYTCELDTNASNLLSTNSIGSKNAVVDFDDKTTTIIENSNKTLSIDTHDFNYYLTENDFRLQVNELQKPFITSYVNNTNIFIRISLKSSNACEGVGQFKIIVNELPIPNGNEEPLLLCVNNPIDIPQLLTIPLNAETGNPTDTYKWYLNNQEIAGETSAILNANKAGTYKVQAFRNYDNNISDLLDDTTCLGYNTFTVFTSNEPLITSFSFLDNQDKSEDNVITIKVSGIGNYEFALNSNAIVDFNKGNDNFTYTFTNVPPGLNIAYVRDKNECGNVIKTEAIPFLYFQRHFTPNGDGKFDTWKVQGVDNVFYKSISYQIYDRYGKLLRNSNQKTDNGWNGLFNGKPLPPNDYWYTIILEDITGNIIRKTGHISLLRD